jgi:hypothetical protein
MVPPGRANAPHRGGGLAIGSALRWATVAGVVPMGYLPVPPPGGASVAVRRRTLEVTYPQKSAVAGDALVETGDR